jgi:hypothetical protein
MADEVRSTIWRRCNWARCRPDSSGRGDVAGRRSATHPHARRQRRDAGRRSDRLQTALLGPAFSLLTPSGVLFHGWGAGQADSVSAPAPVAGTIPAQHRASEPEDNLSWRGAPSSGTNSQPSSSGGFLSDALKPDSEVVASTDETPLGSDWLNAVSAALGSSAISSNGRAAIPSSAGANLAGSASSIAGVAAGSGTSLPGLPGGQAVRLPLVYQAECGRRSQRLYGCLDRGGGLASWAEEATKFGDANAEPIKACDIVIKIDDDGVGGGVTDQFLLHAAGQLTGRGSGFGARQKRIMPLSSGCNRKCWPCAAVSNDSSPCFG